MVIPPPNVTGRLHMGHAINNTFIDFNIRRKQLMGFNAKLIVGIDHAGIATQTKVQRELEKKKIKVSDLSRAEFLTEIYKWKDEHGNLIINQLKKLGCLYDWSKIHFTMDENFSDLVRKSFVELYKKGLIYRNKYIINWCTKLGTALASDEILHEQVKTKLYYFRYPCFLSDSNKIAGQKIQIRKYVTIATTRPETLLGDTAIAYNPNDERYGDLKYYVAKVPFCDREIPFVSDEFVKPEFGTGLVKITPAHNFTDFEVGQRHSLPIITIINKQGHIFGTNTEFDGVFKTKVRKLILEKLKEIGLYEKEILYSTTVSKCYRSGDVIEPMISTQWFVKMKELAGKAKEYIVKDEIKLFPEHNKSKFIQWMDKIHDWCISRQLIWGHQIPIWYHKTNGSIYCEIKPPPDSENYTQDPDVLDTWFSSWLWPFGVLNDTDENDKNRYPTDLLITGCDILFFWVSRMVMASGHFKNQVPFKQVYFHGLVRDGNFDKMSKSKGNVVDPLSVISQYGADAPRFMLMRFMPYDKDIKFSNSHLKESRNFCTKLWNTVRFYHDTFKDNVEISDTLNSSQLEPADYWIIYHFNQLIERTDRSIDQHKYADYATEVHNFVYNKFCNLYLEYCKTMGLSKNSHYVFKHILNNLLILLHPVMPYITEELFSKLNVEYETILENPYGWTQKIKIEDSQYQDKIDDFEKTSVILTQFRQIKLNGIKSHQNMKFLQDSVFAYKLKKLYTLETKLKQEAKLVVHHLKVQNPLECPFFDHLNNGLKVVEGRKNSEKYQKYNVGDQLNFQYGNETLKTKITYIHQYENVKQYLEKETVDRALPGIKTIEHGMEIYGKWVKQKECDELKNKYGFGFLGIGVQKI